MDILYDCLPSNVIDYEVIPYIYKKASSVVKAGRLDILKKQIFKLPTKCSTRLANIAAEHGHLEILKWLYQNLPFNSVNIKTSMYLASTNGHLDCLKWLFAQSTESFRCMPSNIQMTAMYGHLDCLKWIYENSIPGKEYTTSAMHWAAFGGRLDCLKWLYAKGGECTEKIMDWAAEGGHIHVLEWVYNLKNSISCTEAAVNWAVSNGHLDCLKWLYEHGALFDGTNPMDIAASEGRLEYLIWLHEHNFKCSMEAIYHAARNGHLDCIEWLYKNSNLNSNTGYTTNAMDFAALHGHLDCLKWLHEHNFKCTDRAMAWAVRGEHTGCIQYLQNVVPVE